jgi:hypothetical protein
MASSSPSPSLVFVSGSDVTTWDCLKSTQAQRLYPHGGSLIADASWNHNAQGQLASIKFELRIDKSMKQAVS